MKRSLALAALLLAGWGPAALQAQVHARMLRQPDVSSRQIVFVYAGDIWVVSKLGGTAERLSSPQGEESFPRFSPDGSRIAFTGNYDGNRDIYVIPSSGGIPRRITHHPMPDRVLDWYPDGRSILYASAMASGRTRFSQLYRVSAKGGLATRLPLPYGEFGAISPDGIWLAYIPISRDLRTWKRYRGGMAPDIWLFNLEDFSSRNITHSPANDSQPMWHGRTLYFLSDRGPEQRYNVWSYNLDKKRLRQITRFTDFDIHFPAIGPEDMVFEAGGRIYLLSLKNKRMREVEIRVVTDRRSIRPYSARVAKQIQNASISPTGQRALIEARGEVFTIPKEHGVIRNLTHSSGVAERFPAWSPDGKSVAYWSDGSGEYELVLRSADGSGKEQTLTHLGPGFRYQPYWSPDSRKLVFVDQAMNVHLFDVESRQDRKIDQGLYWFQGSLSAFRASWSGDSRWVAYARDLDNRSSAIFLYDTREQKRHQVTSGFYADSQPVFDPDGKYLYFLSQRTLRPSYGDLDNSWIYANTTNVVAVSLRRDVPSPLAPRNDEEKVKEEEEKKAKEGQATGPEKKPEAARKKEEKPKPVEIDLDGFESRLTVLPPAAGNYGGLAAARGKVIYLRLPRTGAGPKAKPILAYYDLQKRKEMTVLAGVSGFDLSADGKKLLVRSRDALAIVDVKPKQKMSKKLPTAQLEMRVDPRAEWHQIFRDAWRFYRDYFYDPRMHGVDWEAMRRHYEPLIDDAVTRWDVNFILGELIAELNSSHTYRFGGATETPKRKRVGLLGVDWKLAKGAYQIARIVRGAPWESEARSPLAAPGVKVKEGDYLLAVNGVPVDTSRDPYAAFEGLAGETVELTVNEQPRLEGAHKILVKTLSSEVRLRNLEWIEQKRRQVEKATNGRVGYIYVPDTSIGGQTDLVRQFMAQYRKEGLIIDERFNSGGQIPDRFIELLKRPVLSYWAVRDGRDWQWPPAAHFGPKVMLINGWSGSGGDAFPYYFREAKLGPLVGMRTWGGLIGISGVPRLIDGGIVTVPTFRMYSPGGRWFAEGHGVDPDIRVVDDPSQMARGHDPQLERAIQEILKTLKQHPFRAPHRPARENRALAPTPGK